MFWTLTIFKGILMNHRWYLKVYMSVCAYVWGSGRQIRGYPSFGHTFSLWITIIGETMYKTKQKKKRIKTKTKICDDRDGCETKTGWMMRRAFASKVFFGLTTSGASNDGNGASRHCPAAPKSQRQAAAVADVAAAVALWSRNDKNRSFGRRSNAWAREKVNVCVSI